MPFVTFKTATRKATIGLAASMLATTLGTALAAAPANADLQGTATFGTPGNYTWTVPAYVNTIDVELFGAAGGDQRTAYSDVEHGAPGGRVQASVPVTPGQTYAIVVGGKGGTAGGTNPGTGGFGGGGNG